MKVIIPVRLEFHVAEDRHTVQEAERFIHAGHELPSNMHSYVGHSEAKAIEQFTLDVQKCYCHSANVQPADYTLHYAVNVVQEVEGGGWRGFVSTQITRSVRLCNPVPVPA